MKLLNARLLSVGSSRCTTIPQDMIEYAGGCKDGRILLRVLSASERRLMENGEVRDR